MLKPTAPFPLIIHEADRQGGCCKSKVDCPGCFSARDYAMIDGMRFYVSFAPFEEKSKLPPSWAKLFTPLTDIIVAIEGIFVGVDARQRPAVTCQQPDHNATMMYIVTVLYRAIAQKHKALGSGATVQLVVLRCTGPGQVAYVVVDAPVADFDPMGGCCGGPDLDFRKSFALVAYSADTWANLNTFVAVKSSIGAFAEGDVLLAINGRPVDGSAAQADALLATALTDGTTPPHALVKRGPLKLESKPKWQAGGWAEQPLKEGCGGAEAFKLAPTGWWQVLVVLLPPEACHSGGLALSTGEYSIGGWPKRPDAFGVDKLAGKFVASSGWWMFAECMRGEWAPVSTDEDPTRDELAFNGFKVYTDVWLLGGHQGGIVIPCVCFPFPICYRYTRLQGGNRFDPRCSLFPCYGPWVMTAHGACCTESGTFTDEDTFESACDCCGKMTRRR